MKNVNKPCCEMLKENCIGCDNATEINGDYCHTLRGYQQGRADRENEIVELLEKLAKRGSRSLGDCYEDGVSDAIDLIKEKKNE